MAQRYVWIHNSSSDTFIQIQGMSLEILRDPCLVAFKITNMFL